MKYLMMAALALALTGCNGGKVNNTDQSPGAKAPAGEGGASTLKKKDEPKKSK